MVPVLSNRLKACCQFVRPGDRVADVGCDHGYLGIFLLLSGVARSVIAADVNTGPLDSARRNGEKYAVADRMTFCLSDGVSSLPRDFDCLVCAGMGADTMISILSAAPWLKDSRYHFILQCQSKTPALRRYLTDQGYSIRRETLARDGKFIYPVMDIVYAPGTVLSEAECYLSPGLLDSGSDLLIPYASRILDGLRKTAAGLSSMGGPVYEDKLRLIAELESMVNLSQRRKEEDCT